jgi:hypothetical protein
MKPTEGPIDPNFTWDHVEPGLAGPKEEPKWEDDAFNKANQKTPAQIEKERIEEKLQYWPWRQAVPRELVTLVRFQLLISF